MQPQNNLFDAAHAGFHRAVQAVGEMYEHDYTLGGYPIRLQFASPLLASKITPALAHRATAPAPPALAICLWDSATTNTPLPPSVGEVVAAARAHWVGILGPRGELADYEDDTFRAAYALGPGVLALLDMERNLAVYWVQDAAQLPYYEQGAPLRTILGWWMNAHGRQLVHAAAVGTAQGGVLLAGKGGSGKSSTALACLDSALQLASDDYALIAVDPAPYVYSLYNTAKLTGQPDLERFPQLAVQVRNLEKMGDEKLMLFLQEQYADKLAGGFPIRAVMAPRVTGKLDTTVRAMAPGAALTALALTTLYQLPGSGQAAMSMMAELLRRVPCYELLLGTEAAQIRRVLLQVLARQDPA